MQKYGTLYLYIPWVEKEYIPLLLKRSIIISEYASCKLLCLAPNTIYMLHEKQINNISVGKIGEDLACDYLGGMGYKISAQNIRQKFGEIDILAKDKKGILCFVEVKTILASYSKFSGLEPEDHLDKAKLLKMKKMAEWYANSHEKEVGKGGYRIDLVCVKLEGAGDSDFSKNTEIKLYTNLI